LYASPDAKSWSLGCANFADNFPQISDSIETMRMSGEAFADSNVFLYLLSSDDAKADCAERLLDDEVVISVQVLNEITNVARKKFDMSWPAIGEFVTTIRAVCSVEPLTVETHERARMIAEKYKVSFYDASIVSSALIAGCKVLYSEDMHAGLIYEKSLRVVNPFR
jgi:predicted nucleic acid-binding protein